MSINSSNIKIYTSQHTQDGGRENTLDKALNQQKTRNESKQKIRNKVMNTKLLKKEIINISNESPENSVIYDKTIVNLLTEEHNNHEEEELNSEEALKTLENSTNVINLLENSSSSSKKEYVVTINNINQINSEKIISREQKQQLIDNNSQSLIVINKKEKKQQINPPSLENSTKSLEIKKDIKFKRKLFSNSPRINRPEKRKSYKDIVSEPPSRRRKLNSLSAERRRTTVTISPSISRSMTTPNSVPRKTITFKRTDSYNWELLNRGQKFWFDQEKQEKFKQNVAPQVIMELVNTLGKSYCKRLIGKDIMKILNKLSPTMSRDLVINYCQHYTIIKQWFDENNINKLKEKINNLNSLNKKLEEDNKLLINTKNSNEETIQQLSTANAKYADEEALNHKQVNILTSRLDNANVEISKLKNELKELREYKFNHASVSQMKINDKITEINLLKNEINEIKNRSEERIRDLKLENNKNLNNLRIHFNKELDLKKEAKDIEINTLKEEINNLQNQILFDNDEKINKLPIIKQNNELIEKIKESNKEIDKLKNELVNQNYKLIEAIEENQHLKRNNKNKDNNEINSKHQKVNSNIESISLEEKCEKMGKIIQTLNEKWHLAIDENNRIVNESKLTINKLQEVVIHYKNKYNLSKIQCKHLQETLKKLSKSLDQNDDRYKESYNYRKLQIDNEQIMKENQSMKIKIYKLENEIKDLNGKNKQKLNLQSEEQVLEFNVIRKQEKVKIEEKVKKDQEKVKENQQNITTISNTLDTIYKSLSNNQNRLLKYIKDIRLRVASISKINKFIKSEPTVKKVKKDPDSYQKRNPKTEVTEKQLKNAVSSSQNDEKEFTPFISKRSKLTQGKSRERTINFMKMLTVSTADPKRQSLLFSDEINPKSIYDGSKNKKKINKIKIESKSKSNNIDYDIELSDIDDIHDYLVKNQNELDINLPPENNNNNEQKQYNRYYMHRSNNNGNGSNQDNLVSNLIGKQIEFKEDEIRQEKYKFISPELKYNGLKIRYAPYFFKRVNDYLDRHSVPARKYFNDLIDYFMQGSLRAWAKKEILKLSHLEDPDELAQEFWKRYFEQYVSPDVLACIWGDMNTIKNCDPRKHEEKYQEIMGIFKYVKAFIDTNFPDSKYYFQCPDMDDKTLIQQKAYVIWPNDYIVKLANRKIRDAQINKEFKYTINQFFKDVIAYYNKLKEEAMLVVRTPGLGPSKVTHNAESDPFHAYAITELITVGKLAKKINYQNPYASQMGKQPKSIGNKKHENQKIMKGKRKRNYKKKGKPKDRKNNDYQNNNNYNNKFNNDKGKYKKKKGNYKKKGKRSKGKSYKISRNKLIRFQNKMKNKYINKYKSKNSNYNNNKKHSNKNNQQFKNGLKTNYNNNKNITVNKSKNQNNNKKKFICRACNGKYGCKNIKECPNYKKDYYNNKNNKTTNYMHISENPEVVYEYDSDPECTDDEECDPAAPAAQNSESGNESINNLLDDLLNEENTVYSGEENDPNNLNDEEITQLCDEILEQENNQPFDVENNFNHNEQNNHLSEEIDSEFEEDSEEDSDSSDEENVEDSDEESEYEFENSDSSNEENSKNINKNTQNNINSNSDDNYSPRTKAFWNKIGYDAEQRFKDYNSYYMHITQDQDVEITDQNGEEFKDNKKETKHFEFIKTTPEKSPEIICEGKIECSDDEENHDTTKTPDYQNESDNESEYEQYGIENTSDLLDITPENNIKPIIKLKENVDIRNAFHEFNKIKNNNHESTKITNTNNGNILIDIPESDNEESFDDKEEVKELINEFNEIVNNNQNTNNEETLNICQKYLCNIISIIMCFIILAISIPTIIILTKSNIILTISLILLLFVILTIIKIIIIPKFTLAFKHYVSTCPQH